MTPASQDALPLPGAAGAPATPGKQGTASRRRSGAAGSARSPGKDGKAKRIAPPKEACDQDPVARVAVDVSLLHLDRLFDYLVPTTLADAAVPGARVRVRFAGRLVDGFVIERAERSEHTGRLGFLERVTSPEPVLTPEVAALARAVADRYVGSLADVLRLAVPPRHARAESSVPELSAEAPSSSSSSSSADAPARPGARTSPPAIPTSPPGASPPGAPSSPLAGPSSSPESPDIPIGWKTYPAGPAFLGAVRRRAPARAVWQAAPGEDWPTRLAEAAAVADAAGRGALLLVPDARDLARLETALTTVLGPDGFVALSADLGPAERYRRFLRVRRGLVRVVAGTRAAAFAPVRDLALVALFDDGDDMFAEPRAPYPHAREVLMMRSAATGCALLVGGFGRTAEAQLLVESGWAHDIVAARDTVRRRSPRIEAQGDSYAIGADSAASAARLSPAAFAAARAALAADRPVLVQVPRAGYLPTLACAECRRPARCKRCHGPLAIAAGNRIPSCRWCGVAEAHFVCGACGGTELRAAGQGARRTAEELGRAFPGITLVTSAGDSIRSSVPAKPAIVVATPGAEPVADNGYGVALLLDGGLLLSRPELRAAEETLRRWFAAAALVRSADDGGRVVLGVDGSVPTAQALIRWDPVWHAAAELADRRELGFPPAVAMASLTGDEVVVNGAVEELALPEDAELLGPVPVEAAPGPPRNHGGDEPEYEKVRALVRVTQARRRGMAAALRAMAAELSTRRNVNPPRIQVDPADAL